MLIMKTIAQETIGMVKSTNYLILFNDKNKRRSSLRREKDKPNLFFSLSQLEQHVIIPLRHWVVNHAIGTVVYM